MTDRLDHALNRNDNITTAGDLNSVSDGVVPAASGLFCSAFDDDGRWRQIC